VKKIGLRLRRSLLLIGVVCAALYVTVSLAFDETFAGPQLEVHPSSGFGNSDLVGGVARTCTSCHVLNQMENGVGPHLVDIVDRRAGAVSGYAYSEALRHTDIRWTRARLRAFLVNPQAVVPGTAMVTPAIDENTADAIVNYLSRRP
jgi:cytochrome c